LLAKTTADYVFFLWSFWDVFESFHILCRIWSKVGEVKHGHVAGRRKLWIQSHLIRQIEDYVGFVWVYYFRVMQES